MANYFNTLNLRRAAGTAGRMPLYGARRFADGASYLQGKSGHRRLRARRA